MSVAAAQLGVFGPASVQASVSKSTGASASKSGTNASFGPLKQINAALLNVGYTEAGPANGPAVLLLHGWPYDIHSYVDVAPILASAGYHVIVPYFRGYGTTSFLSSATMRNAQQSAVGLDMIALMDALKIQTATVAGFDWGARTADVMESSSVRPRQAGSQGHPRRPSLSIGNKKAVPANSDGCKPPQPSISMHVGVLLHLHFHDSLNLGASRVQNSTRLISYASGIQKITQLLGDPLIVSTGHMCVRAQRHAGIAVPKPFLTHLMRMPLLRSSPILESTSNAPKRICG